MKKTLYFNPNEETALYHFSEQLLNFIKKTKKDSQTLVLVCIGTDRATGDCLGPLVGYYLEQMLPSETAVLYGNLSHPVHAINLTQTLDEIYLQFESPYIIVIDACLGYPDHVGYVTLSNDALQPGKGVNKQLPSIGHISITGIVDQYSNRNYATIQHTPLCQVMNLATFIANGITNLISCHPL
ncbi:MAG: spore protease YyaC [Lachnospiraceae bacterium]|nr:spore protease YyaC [Lachnospiraceae bacterium]